jgi:hypothetical protein
MEIHPRRSGASALIDAASDGLLLASSRTGDSGSIIAVVSLLISRCSFPIAHFSWLIVVHRIIRHLPHLPTIWRSAHDAPTPRRRGGSGGTNAAHHHCRNVRPPRQLTVGQRGITNASQSPISRNARRRHDRACRLCRRRSIAASGAARARNIRHDDRTTRSGTFAAAAELDPRRGAGRQHRSGSDSAARAASAQPGKPQEVRPEDAIARASFPSPRSFAWHRASGENRGRPSRSRAPLRPSRQTRA